MHFLISFNCVVMKIDARDTQDIERFIEKFQALLNVLCSLIKEKLLRPTT